MKKVSVIVASFAAACLWFGLGQTAHAQEASPTPQEAAPAAQNQPSAPATYEFVAQSGNSMSVMARKAVQLYDKEAADINLPEPCIVAAETKIVQSMGARWLNEGEKFVIDGNLVADQARQASGLTDEQKTAWSVYSNNADFTLADVKLASEVATQNGAATTPEQNNTDQTPPADQQSTNDQESESNNTTNGSAPWYWWVVGAGTIAALYYLLGGKPQKEKTSSK